MESTPPVLPVVLIGSATDTQKQLKLLVSTGITSLGKLNELLPVDDDRLRRASLSLLAQTDRRIATPIFLRLLSIPEYAGEKQVFSFLFKSQSRRVYEKVIETLTRSDSKRVKIGAIRSIPYKFGNEAIIPLLQMAKNKQEITAVREKAIERIGVFVRDERSQNARLAVNEVKKLLQDREAGVRFWCCNTLGLIRAKSAIPSLKRVVRSDEAYYKPKRRALKVEAGSAIVVYRT